MPRTTTVHAVTAIGMDMGKNTLHMIGLDARGAIVLREKVSRGRIALRFANMPPCLIGIEAGLATHYVARELAALGHDVKQVPPAYAKPFRQVHKNDFRDAHAVAEAVQRPTTRFVPAKTDEQLDLQALHRVRSRLVSDRTAVPMNLDVSLPPPLAAFFLLGAEFNAVQFRLHRLVSVARNFGVFLLRLA